MHTILSQKPEVVDFTKVADILNVPSGELDSEWSILRRLPGNLSTQDNLIMLATSPEKCAMFPTFSNAIYKLLLLPVGTATVERSFSTMNRILNSGRCRLLPGHTCQLMQLSVEGPLVPDVRDATDGQLAGFSEIIDKAYRLWLAKPRRGMQCE
jgi:hAT family C-terminal dimerisation region